MVMGGRSVGGGAGGWWCVLSFEGAEWLVG